MKTLKQFLLAFATLLALFSCERTIEVDQLKIQASEELTLSDAELQELQNLDRGFYGRGKRLKFKAKFITEQDRMDPRFGFGSGDCTDTNYPFLNVQKGGGQGTPLGTFDTEIIFCVKLPSPEDLQIDYKEGKGIFYLEDGHELYIEIPVGVVELIPQPATYQAKFHDRFIITGGTGPYENSRGVGYTNSFVTFFPEGGDRTQHNWIGLIVLEEEG